MAKQLPQGKWISFENLPFETTEEDLQNLIANRTGVVIGIECISVEYFGKKKTSRALISMNGEHTAALLTWALSDDRLYGAIVQASIRQKSGK